MYVLAVTCYFSSACAINLGSSVILTGGWEDSDVATRVSEYNEDGYVRDLPPLQQGRDNHGCSYFDNDEGTKVDMDIQQSLSSHLITFRRYW